MSIVKINKSFSLGKEGNFWTLNPAMTLYSPYNKLYLADTSRDKTVSSKKMWCIVFLTDPDEEVNPFYNREFDDVVKMLSENFVPDMVWDEPLFVECLNRWPDDCLTPTAKAVKDEITSMGGRAKMMRETEYVLDRSEEVEDSRGNTKIVTFKGTATQLDAMRKATPSLIDNYEKLRASFLSEKSIKARGERKLTKVEKGNFW